jgi:ABC-type lipoprotein export system ATPase subunit
MPAVTRNDTLMTPSKPRLELFLAQNIRRGFRVYMEQNFRISMSQATPVLANSTAVQAFNVVRQYQMGQSLIRAVDGVSLTIARGEFVALLGASGSGKSTLLNLIAGLDRPSSGSIVVNGCDLAQMSSTELARHRRETVGMIFQSFNLIPTMTLEENIELPLRFAEVDRNERGDRIHQALERVGLLKRLGHRPPELSGGEQQRVAIARALVNRPKLLLADEPTGNLDSRTGAEVMEVIKGLNQSLGVTVIIVTHERALADQYTTRSISLADGRVVEEVRA